MPVRRLLVSLVFILPSLAAAAWLSLAGNADAARDAAACVEGTFRINDNGSPQVCVKR